jgi:hypothetical protein
MRKEREIIIKSKKTERKKRALYRQIVEAYFVEMHSVHMFVCIL